MSLASVQTTADSAPLSLTQVLVAVAAVFILALVIFLPVLFEAWKAAHEENVVDLDAVRAKRPSRDGVVPLQRDDVRLFKGRGWSA